MLGVLLCSGVCRDPASPGPCSEHSLLSQAQGTIQAYREQPSSLVAWLGGSLTQQVGKASPRSGSAVLVLGWYIPALLLGLVLQVPGEPDLKAGGCLLSWNLACRFSGLSRSPGNLPRLHITFINKLLCHLFVYSCQL